MELGEIKEDYLEAIYVLGQKKKPLKGAHIAAYMKRAKPSVFRVILELDKMGYIIKNEDASIELTDKGLKLALKIQERHYYFKQLLIHAGVTSDVAENEACQMEHVLSEDSYKKLKIYFEKSLYKNR